MGCHLITVNLIMKIGCVNSCATHHNVMHQHLMVKVEPNENEETTERKNIKTTCVNNKMDKMMRIGSCFKCKYFIKCKDPRFIQYSKCALFGYRTGRDITYEFANACRKSDGKCGGKYFTPNDVGRHH